MTSIPDSVQDLFLLECKPLADPYARHGINREPIYRLKRLLKFAARDCGFRVRWGPATSPDTLLQRETSEQTMIRFTDGPATGKTLMLRRAPLYLRVTLDTLTQKWDALDQLTDTPAAGEAIFVYRRVGEPSAAFIDWTEKGRRRGGRMAIASYALVKPQPDDATMRDTEAWRTWCWSQVRSAPAASA